MGALLQHDPDKCYSCGSEKIYKFDGKGALCKKCALGYDDICQPRKVEPEPGRNQPCPCNSGKKYKKCCGG